MEIISTKERLEVAEACKKIMEILDPERTEQDLDAYEAAKKLKIMFASDVAKNGDKKTELKFVVEGGFTSEDMFILVLDLDTHIPKIATRNFRSEKTAYSKKEEVELEKAFNTVFDIYMKYVDIPPQTSTDKAKITTDILLEQEVPVKKKLRL
jgi:hypothetical protein